jgi:serine/threonine-protein kinase
MTERTIGNYRIVRELGQGAMGAVYEAIDVMVERRVAIKMLRAEIARQPDLIERFRVEAVTLARLNHPSTALLYNFFREGEDYYMVMEFVPGRTLDAILKESGSLAPAAAADIQRQMLEGMAHAHRMGVLHRDIKPANIMVTGDGQVKVTDFGIARVLGASRMTREGRIIGTLEYIAPERIRGHEADIRSDLYSAGIVLYEMLAGRLPFVSDTDFALMHAHLEQTPPPLAELGVRCPPELEAVIRKALAKAPAERFQTAEEFREAVMAVVPAAAPPVMKATRLADPTQVMNATRLAEAPPPSGGGPAPSGRRPMKWMAIGAAVLAVVVVAVALWFWMNWRWRGASSEEAVSPQPTPIATPTPEEAETPRPLPPGLTPTPTPTSPSGGGRTLEQILGGGNEAAPKKEVSKPARRTGSQDDEKRRAAERALDTEQRRADDARRDASRRALDQ